MTATAVVAPGYRPAVRRVHRATCDVEAGDMVAANALYRSIGFTEECRGHARRKDAGRI